jgi:hypothetical protein
MKLLDYQGLLAKGIPWSKPHLWRKEKAKEFPKASAARPAVAWLG